MSNRHTRSTDIFYGKTKNKYTNIHKIADNKSLSNNVNWKRLPKTRQKEFLSALKAKESIKGVKQEDIVQSAWYSVLNYCFAEPNKNYATHIAKLLETDGLMFVKDITVALSLITEFKDDINMDKHSQQERVLAQVIYYLKRIQEHINNGNKLNLTIPNVVLAADVNQAFVVNARVLYPYLDMDIDWSRNPRAAYDTRGPRELFDRLDNDNNINPYVYDTRVKGFDLNDVLGLVADLASAENEAQLKKIPVNQSNIRGAYDEFLRLVTQSQTRVKTNQELVSLFIQVLTDHDRFILRNNKVTVLNANGTYKNYRVNGRNWYAFFSRFDTNYSADEVKNITAVGDVLLEETNRRFSGEYWTPTIWADKAINALSEVLGTNWKQTYYVWDNAAGSKNLTRDYKFKNLFSSTLFPNELAIGKEYNVGNVAFQYDFLNDDPDLNPDNIDDSKLAKCAPELVEALKNDRPIVFFTNPPYGTSGNTVGKQSKSDIAKTKINEQMRINGMGHASENLYCQFFYRAVQFKKIFHLTNAVIAYFSNSQYLTSSNYFNSLRKEIFSNFDFEKGFIFNAGEFSDTASNWGISFTILRSKPTNNLDNIPNIFKLDVNESDIRGIHFLGTHVIYAFPETDGLAQWVKDIDIHSANNIKDNVTMVTGAFTASKAKPTIFYPENAIGYAWFKGNNVEYADRETGLFSTDFSRQRGVPITPDNFERTMINFAVRRATHHTWINNKDNYHKPNASFYDNKVALADMVVFSIFNNKNLSSSLLNFEYNNKLHRVNNELFWMSKNEIKKYAAEAKFSDMGFAINNDHERFMYKWIVRNHQYLSSEAKDVLSLSTKIVKDTFSQRKILDGDYPNYCLMCWDAGWEQIRKINQKGRQSEYYDSFVDSYQTLLSKVNSYIYQYEFLKSE